MPAVFRIDQIALYPIMTEPALNLLEDLGLTDWVQDTVKATGEVNELPAQNTAKLMFNYQAGNGSEGGKPLELEMLEYTEGRNWMDESIESGQTSDIGAVSHLGMHVTEEELIEFDAIFKRHSIYVAQKVNTIGHTNPAIKDKRRYKYVIYATREVIGVDLKFIVRIDF